MNTEQAHIIHKIAVKVNTNSLEKGHYLKENVGSWITDYILPCLENCMAEMEQQVGDQIVQFEKIKISFDIKSGDFHLDGVPEYVAKEILLQLQPVFDAVYQSGKNTSKSVAEEKEGKFVDPAKREVETFFYFLKTGKKPWWISPEKLNELLGENNLSRMIIRNSKPFFEAFFSLLGAENVRTRLIRQFTNGFLYKLVYNSFSYTQGKALPDMYPKELNLTLNKLSQAQKEYFWNAVIRLFLDVREGSSGDENRAKIFKPIIAFLASKKNKPTVQHQYDVVGWLEELTHSRIPESERQTLFFDVIDEKFALPTENKPAAESEKEKTNVDSEIALSENEKAEDKTKEKDLEMLKKSENPENIESPEVSENIEISESISELNNQIDPSLKEGIIIENAGLILLHPFLKNFLLKTKLVDEQNVLQNPFLIAHVFHYMATGRQHDWDHNLLFEKFLCNIPLTTSIPRKMIIPAEIKQEVDELLASVLEHWKALGSSSIELLRNEFLQRPGKLNADDFSVRLVLERKTHDILMDQLPWGISIARLPWQKQIIYTTW